MLLDITNFHQINTNLAASGQPTETQLKEIKQYGFEVVINLAMHNNPQYSLPDEAGFVNSLGMRYIHIPVKFDAPNRDDLIKFLQAMRENQKSKVLVHCAMNYRASAFIGLFNVIELRQDVDQAFSLMRQVWQPDEIWTEFIHSMLNSFTAETKSL